MKAALIACIAGLAALVSPSLRPAAVHASPLASTFQRTGLHARVAGPRTPSAVYLGVSVHQWDATDMLSSLARYQTEAGKNAALVMYWRDWAKGGQIEPEVMNAIYNQGSVPIISWSPGCWSCSDQSAYSLDNILAGNFDQYIQSFASSLAAYHRTVLLRFGPEMNGCWDTYACQPAKFVQVWRYIHDIFVRAGATNVQWVWCPNVDWDGNHPFAAYYPGDAYVNWLGLDGYNRPWTTWQTFQQLFQSSMNELDALNSTAPVMIGETASGEATSAEAAQGLTKAEWISNAYRSGLAAFPRIQAIVWFDQDKSSEEHCPCVWQIDSSSGASSAYAQAVAGPQFASRWS